MKKIIILLIFVSFAESQFAQDTTATIKIKKTKWKVLITSNDSILWIDKENHVSIAVEGGMNYCVNIKDGKINCNRNNYTIQVFQEGTAILTVYEKLPNKRLRTLHTKLYQVKRIPDPVPYVCGVKSDSVIDKLQIIHDNIVTITHPFYKLELPVLGFEVIFSIAGKADTLTSKNNHFTMDMRKRIYYLPSGSILYFENVYCEMPDGKVKKIKPFEIFITETNKYKVGYRVIGL